MEEAAEGTKGLLAIERMGFDIDSTTPSPEPLFPTSEFLALSPRLFHSSRPRHHPPPSVWVPPALSADRPGCLSARDAMPEAAAGSSGKSFLQRARGKVLRWLRRSLRTTHQVKTSRDRSLSLPRVRSAARLTRD